MNQDKFKKIEYFIVYILLFYYSTPNLPDIVIQFLALFGFIVVPLLSIYYWKRFSWVVVKDLSLLLLILIVPASVAWSTNPSSTLAYSRAFLCSTGFGIYLSTRFSPQELIKLLAKFFSFLIIINLIVPIFLPSYGILSNGWVGITPYKNYLASAMTMVATFFMNNLIYGVHNRFNQFIKVCLAFLLLLLSQGKGSLGIFLGTLILLPFYKINKQEYRFKTLLTIFAVLLSACITTLLFLNRELVVIDFMGKDMGFNGRGELWEHLIQRGLEKPLFGYGYAGFWTNISESLNIAFKFPWIHGAGEGGGNSHSSYIEVFLQLGLVGILLTSTSLIMYLIRNVYLLVLTKKIEFFWMIQFYLIVIFVSYSDTIGILNYRNLFWVLYVANSYSSAIEMSRIIKNRIR